MNFKCKMCTNFKKDDGKPNGPGYDMCWLYRERPEKNYGEAVDGESAGGAAQCIYRDAIDAGRIYKCRGCGKETVWMNTRGGSHMLVDAESWHGEKLFVHGVNLPHWGTCPKAKQFHKKFQNNHRGASHERKN